MQDIGFALLFMSISAFVAIALAGKGERSKASIYAVGLAVMLLQIVVLFAFRGTHLPQQQAGLESRAMQVVLPLSVAR